MDIYIRANEGAGPAVPLAWDTLATSNLLASLQFDWALAGPSEIGNRGGLQARAGLETAVIIALFTDARVPDDHPLRASAGDDPRGWWGDGVDVRVDLDEGPLGSLLWLLERQAMTPDILRYARQMAQDALAPLIAQQACARVDVTAAWIDGAHGLALGVTLYGRDGAKLHARQFDILWSQINGV